MEPEDVMQENSVQPAQVEQKAIAPAWKRALGSTTNHEQANSRLQYLAGRGAGEAHLVTPSTSVAQLPAGTSLVFSAVWVDIENETYAVTGGKRALSKAALEKIAAAAGISWDPVLSRRTDSGKDPCFCTWQAVGSLRQLDGTMITLVGSVELDLRDGSPTVEGMLARGRDQSRAQAQLREVRMFIVRHAESKARLRAIRSLGLRPAYHEAELRRPFVVARLMWTGHSDDPETRRIFAAKTAENFLGARSALYGAPAALPAVLPAAAAADDELLPALEAHEPKHNHEDEEML